MDQESVVKYTKRKPFKPFILHLSDGQALRVQHPEFFGFTDDILAVQLEDASRHVVNLEQIVSIEYRQIAPKE